MIDIRKTIRLIEYDYSNEGMYFITICTKDRKCLLSEIEECRCDDLSSRCRGEHCSSFLPKLTAKGKVVEKYIKKIEEIYKNVELDEYVIMPNHIHMILVINRKQNNTISNIIQQLKGKITKEIRYSIWQKLFYEHIIRNEKEYLQTKEYIINNPINWTKDEYY